LGNLSNTVLEAMAAGNCIVMLGKEKETHTDESTERLVPDDVVIRINRQDIVNDLTDKLIDLIDNHEKINMYSERMEMFSNDFLWSWEERVKHEIELLEMVAKGETIVNNYSNSSR
jgi:glycosyltransferase involved in cell wall biosynthesis